MVGETVEGIAVEIFRNAAEEMVVRLKHGKGKGKDNAGFEGKTFAVWADAMRKKLKVEIEQKNRSMLKALESG
jgi:hypothetical protein